METTIPKDSTIPAIGQSTEDSAKDTQGAADVTADNQNTTSVEDSNGNTQDDTQDPVKSKIDELNQQLAELNRKTSDKERRQYEARRNKVASNPDKILEVYEDDPDQANKIVKSLWGEQGYNSVDDLLAAVKTQEEEKQISDPEVLKIKREKDELRKKVESLESNMAQKDEQEALNQIYSKYPNLHPANDPDNENWVKFKQEFDVFSSSIPVSQRADKAFKLAFGDVDEDETRALQKSLGSLPSTGGTPKPQKPIKVSEEAQRVAERTGVDPTTVEKYKDFF